MDDDDDRDDSASGSGKNNFSRDSLDGASFWTCRRRRPVVECDLTKAMLCPGNLLVETKTKKNTRVVLKVGSLRILHWSCS